MKRQPAPIKISNWLPNPASIVRAPANEASHKTRRHLAAATAIPAPKQGKPSVSYTAVAVRCAGKNSMLTALENVGTLS